MEAYARVVKLGGSEKWAGSGDILKTEPKGFTDRPNQSGRERG